MSVKSVFFPKIGNGYIYQKTQKPLKPDKVGRFRRQKDEDVYQKELEQYQKELEYYKEHKGEYVLDCSNNLIGKKFSFDNKKINILFGPNGCGKSTILKTIAGKALITDGYSRFFEPLDFPGWDNDGQRYAVETQISKLSMNTAKVEWSGNPIYCNNFSYTLKIGGMMLGGLQGTILGDMSEEMFYRMNIDNKSSDGQKAAFIFNRIFKIALGKKSLKDIISPYANKFLNANEAWSKCGRNQLEYFKQFEDFEKECPSTIVLDEVDKSLDILTVSKLYREVFPMIVEKTGCQIITVSHNPLVLSDKITGDTNDYNLISLDKNYTENAKKTIHDLFG